MNPQSEQKGKNPVGQYRLAESTSKPTIGAKYFSEQSFRLPLHKKSEHSFSLAIS